jgi:WD40 repeat protein
MISKEAGSVAGVPHRWFHFDAYVTGLAFDAKGRAVFACGDGVVRIAGPKDEAPPAEIAAHEGAIQAFAVHGEDVLTGGDDGRFVRTRNGKTQELLKIKDRWIEQAAASAASGALACASGKTLYVWPKGAALPTELVHGSSVTGLAFDPKGRRIAASRYNGVSIWWANADPKQTPAQFEWKGSHTGVWWHPGGDYVVTAMQENALHGWRLSDKAHMRMAGYPSKIRSMDWTAKGKWLVTSGAEAAICWPFEGKGPMGKNAREAGPGGSFVTAVGCHPVRDLIATGHADGSIWLTRFEDGVTAALRTPGAAQVTALAWDGRGAFLAFGTEDGAAGILNFEGAMG